MSISICTFLSGKKTLSITAGQKNDSILVFLEWSLSCTNCIYTWTVFYVLENIFFSCLSISPASYFLHDYCHSKSVHRSEKSLSASKNLKIELHYVYFCSSFSFLLSWWKTTSAAYSMSSHRSPSASGIPPTLLFYCPTITAYDLRSAIFKMTVLVGTPC